MKEEQEVVVLLILTGEKGGGGDDVITTSWRVEEVWGCWMLPLNVGKERESRAD